MHGTIIPISGTNEPNSGGGSVTYVAHHEETRTIARKLEDRIVRKTGCLQTARQAIARKIGGGFAPGTLETLRKGRLKRVDGWVRDRIRDLLVREIEREIEALAHELDVYRRTHHNVEGSSPVAEITAIEELIAQARSKMALASAGASSLPS